jgi:hypothetical protein
MGGEGEKITFLNYLSAALRTKRAKKTLSSVNGPLCFMVEKEQIRRIERLVDIGKCDEALRHMVRDIDVDNPIQYFNQIRSKEQKERRRDAHCYPFVKVSCDEPKEILESIEIPIATVHNRECQWSGLNKDYDALKCANMKHCHPWKKRKNVCGQKESLVSNFCIYHQKYCVDSGRRHTDALLLITVPNIHGLCSECHILQEGNPPVKTKRHPGMRRKFTLEEKERLRLKSQHVEHSIHIDQGRSRDEKLKASLIENKYDCGMTRIITAKNVGQNLKKSLVRNIKRKQYDRNRLKSESAIWIQSLFRYKMLRKRIKCRQIKDCLGENDDRVGKKEVIKELITTPLTLTTKA